MVRRNKLHNGKISDKYVVEKDNYSGVYKLCKYVIGSGKWIVHFEYDIKELAKFIKANDVFLYNWKEYAQMLEEQ